MDIVSLVPLDPDELMETAKKNTGFSNFGSHEWLEGFEIFVHALNEEADLHLMGRLMARSDILRWLEARLGIEQAYAENPEIEEESIRMPVIITGLPRSGTSILFEILAQDPQFGSLLHWEILFPYPPPEASNYDVDPRIDRAERLVTQWSRVVPTYATMHEMGARIPNECIIAMSCTFMSENLMAQYQIPSYIEWYSRQDLHYAYAYYKRFLKVLQWKNPRCHWLLKAPPHLGNLPQLFQAFPDARVIVTHRDPVRAQASVTNLLGTLYWMRSDKPFDAVAFESLLKPENVAIRLNKVIDQLQSGEVPSTQICNFQYSRLIRNPLEAVEQVYADAGLDLSDIAKSNMRNYVQKKPKGKFGNHNYQLLSDTELSAQRALYQPYQRYFGCPNEI